jgi:hypothetical protein
MAGQQCAVGAGLGADTRRSLCTATSPVTGMSELPCTDTPAGRGRFGMRCTWLPAPILLA